MAKCALVTGASGQDGAYLCRLLLEKGYKVVGTIRRSSGYTAARLDELGVADSVELVQMELLEESNIRRIIRQYKPDELYNLAAQSFVGASFECPIYTANIDALGTLRLLEAIRDIRPECRFYQASTSEMFGKVVETPQSETTPFYPRSPYGVAKVFAHQIVKNYRESHDLFCCSGILFNHESPLRGQEFLTRKVTLGLARVSLGTQEHVALGNLAAQRDWGYADDYVRGMHAMLQQDEADDYVLATGRTTTVRDFTSLAAAALDFDVEWDGDGSQERGLDRRSGRCIIKVDPQFYRPAEVDLLCGDASKAETSIGWRPTTTLESLVGLMTEADRNRVASGRVAF